MNKVCMLLADGFEDIEAVASIDLLRRAGITVDLVTNNEPLVLSGLGTYYQSTHHINDINKEDYNLLFLPGGKGVGKLDASQEVHKLLDYFLSNNKYIAAICAAPLILGKRGDLDGKKFTCYPTFEKYMPNGIHTPVGVIQDGNIITGRGVGFALAFGLYLIELLLGKDTRIKIEESTLIGEHKQSIK